MSKSLINKIDRERTLARAREPKVIEKLCRITLADTWPHAVDITWCEGLGKPTNLYVLEPGKSIVWPHARAVSYFGPFNLYKIYERTTDEKELEVLRDRISTETARYLNRYDYPRAGGGAVSMVPTGPHRSPDITIETIGDSGQVEEKVRLYELYGIGEFDEWTFEVKPSEEEIKAHYEAKLEQEAKDREREREAMRRELAELRGMVKASMAKTQPAA